MYGRRLQPPDQWWPRRPLRYRGGLARPTRLPHREARPRTSHRKATTADARASRRDRPRRAPHPTPAPATTRPPSDGGIVRRRRGRDRGVRAVRRRPISPRGGSAARRADRPSRTVRDEHPRGDRADAARPSHGALHPQRSARRVREQGSSRLRVRPAARLGRAHAVPDRRPRLRPPARDRINDGERPRGRDFESSPLHSGHEPSIGRVPNDSLEL